MLLIDIVNGVVVLPGFLPIFLLLPDIGVLSLTELAAREVAASLPFELVEAFYPPVPEQLQLRIAFWSFPEQVRE